MKRIKTSEKCQLTINYDFTGTRLRGNFFTPVKWNLLIDISVLPRKNISQEELRRDFNVYHQKLYYWLDVNLPNIILVNVNIEEDLYLANMSSNMMMYFPNDVTDFIFAKLLHSKLSVLSEDVLNIGKISIKSDDSFLQHTYECDDLNYELPETTEEYCKFAKMRDLAPWWARNDGFCFEFAKSENDEISDEELYKDIIDPLDDFEKMILSDEDVDKEPAKIIQIEKWKPKKV